MRITRVFAKPLRIPLDGFFYNTDGAGTKREWGGRLSRVTPERPGPLLEYVLVYVETDAGLVGVGEAPADIGFLGQTVEGITYAINDYLGPLLVGLEPWDIAGLMDRIELPPRRYTRDLRLPAGKHRAPPHPVSLSDAQRPLPEPHRSLV